MPGKLSTHVLDLVRGRPASGLRVKLSRITPMPGVIKTVMTNADGRTEVPLLGPEEMRAGTYLLEFNVAEYFTAKGVTMGEVPFLDVVPVRFNIADANASYHVPLLVTPWSYNTYRGS